MDVPNSAIKLYIAEDFLALMYRISYVSTLMLQHAYITTYQSTELLLALCSIKVGLFSGGTVLSFDKARCTNVTELSTSSTQHCASYNVLSKSTQSSSDWHLSTSV